MNPDFGGDVDQDLLELWESDTSLNTINSFSSNIYNSSNLDANMNFDSPPQSDDQLCSAFQESYLSPVERRQPLKLVLPSSVRLPKANARRPTRNSKKVSFSSSSESSISFDYSSEESFVPSTPSPTKQRPKRATRAKSVPAKSSPIKKASSPRGCASPAVRGRGRPKKDDDDVDDDKLIHKRKYARAYREQHQQAVKNYQLCAMDFYNTLVANGINVKQKFPQHSKVIQKLIDKMPVNKSTASAAVAAAAAKASKKSSRRRR
uniref:Uncharacterized protein n=1 Tax=Panagrolaimus sp. ES5 TaxID=591445 RepID=A0AC34FSZ9_9BILA